MIRLTLIWLLILPLVGIAQCDSLYTLYDENNSQDGIMFDIVAYSSVTIVGFDASLEDSINPHSISVYYKNGSHVLFEQDTLAWTLIDSVTGFTGEGHDKPTPIPISINVPILTGDTVAFYITEYGDVSNSQNMHYTNGTTLSSIYSTDGVISILEGTGKNYLFDSSYQPRVPNITVHYSCSVTTGVFSAINNGELTLYPNPTTSSICIQLPENNLSATRTSLYDISGRLVHQQPFNPNMDLDYLDRGTYILVVETEEGNFRGTVQKQ